MTEDLIDLTAKMLADDDFPVEDKKICLDAAAEMIRESMMTKVHHSSGMKEMIDALDFIKEERAKL